MCQADLADSINTSLSPYICSEIGYVSPLVGLETDWFNIPLISYVTFGQVFNHLSLSICIHKMWLKDDPWMINSSSQFFFFVVSVYKVFRISWWAIYDVKWNKTLILRPIILFPLHQPKLHIQIADSTFRSDSVFSQSKISNYNSCNTIFKQVELCGLSRK